MYDAFTLIELYAEHFEREPKVIGRYEDCIKRELLKITPLIISLNSDT